MARSIPYYDDGLQVAYPDFSQKQSIVASPHGAGTDGKEVHHGMYGEGKEVYHGAYEQKEVYIEDDSRKARKRICGLSPLVFWLVVAIAVLVVGGAVGGGVGGSLASKNSRETVLESGPSQVLGTGTGTGAVQQGAASTSPAISDSIQQSQSQQQTLSTSQSSSHTNGSIEQSTTKFVQTPSNTPTAILDDANCPSSNGTLIASSTSTFITLCDTNIIGVGRSIDLGFVRTSSLQSCVNVCTEWNSNVSSTNGRKKCVAVSWAVNVPGVSTVGQGDYKTCWYKSANSLQTYNPDLTAGLGSASAVLV